MPRITRRRTISVVALLLALGVLWVREHRTPPTRPTEPARAPVDAGNWRTVSRVVDGDTVILDSQERVRLIGVNTPESVDPRRPVQRFGREASRFLHELAEGRRVRVEYDQQTRDRYGRTLAYLYLENGTFVNAEIIRKGYGFAYTRFPFRYMQEFRQLEREAREQQRGLWARR